MAFTATQRRYAEAKARVDVIREEVRRRVRGVPCGTDEEIDAHVRLEMAHEAELGYEGALRDLKAAEEALFDQVEALARKHGNAEALRGVEAGRRSPFLKLRAKLVDIGMRAPLLG